MVSFDVCSLFTNIPLETIDIAVNVILENNVGIKITKKELKQLFIYATSKTHFLFNDSIYDQIDGVAMGSPLAPVLANLFMGHYEHKWIQGYSGIGPGHYRRYVDDIFALFETEEQADLFFSYLNKQHPNISFTIEKQENGKLPFLDVLLTKEGEIFSTSVYHKSTYTGLLTNYLSFTSFSYKVSLIKTLIDRTYKICGSWVQFNTEILQLTEIFKRNRFPDFLISKTIKTYLNKKMSCQLVTDNTDKPDLRYFKLPYTGLYAKIAQNKINKLIYKFCKNIDIKIVYTSSKICDYFSTKDQFTGAHTSRVVYKFTCAGCNACYVGETSLHLSTRINEHLCTDKSSHIYKHIHTSQDCHEVCNKDCFVVLDQASTSWQLKLKEGLYISWINPNLNKQVRHCIITITV